MSISKFLKLVFQVCDRGICSSLFGVESSIAELQSLLSFFVLVVANLIM